MGGIHDDIENGVGFPSLERCMYYTGDSGTPWFIHDEVEGWLAVEQFEGGDYYAKELPKAKSFIDAHYPEFAEDFNPQFIQSNFPRTYQKLHTHVFPDGEVVDAKSQTYAVPESCSKSYLRCKVKVTTKDGQQQTLTHLSDAIRINPEEPHAPIINSLGIEKIPFNQGGGFDPVQYNEGEFVKWDPDIEFWDKKYFQCPTYLEFRVEGVDGIFHLDTLYYIQTIPKRFYLSLMDYTDEDNPQQIEIADKRVFVRINSIQEGNDFQQLSGTSEWIDMGIILETPTIVSSHTDVYIVPEHDTDDNEDTLEATVGSTFRWDWEGEFVQGEFEVQLLLLNFITQDTVLVRQGDYYQFTEDDNTADYAVPWLWRVVVVQNGNIIPLDTLPWQGDSQGEQPSGGFLLWKDPVYDGEPTPCNTPEPTPEETPEPTPTSEGDDRGEMPITWITPPQLVDGTELGSYSQQIQAEFMGPPLGGGTGGDVGTPVDSYVIVGGDFPTGLNFNEGSGNISGTIPELDSFVEAFQNPPDDIETIPAPFNEQGFVYAFGSFGSSALVQQGEDGVETKPYPVTFTVGAVIAGEVQGTQDYTINIMNNWTSDRNYFVSSVFGPDVLQQLINDYWGG